ncbi:MAG TPA: dihydrodipicolinate synthase family protein [Candidatus Hydrogenedentes bacterium]|nr:dihydrodipicolinate synthase family protein [Candidatus Hydrogenedentota bacterium]
MEFTTAGILSALTTPFTRDGERVDYDRLLSLARAVVQQGATGFFCFGTTGEGLMMSPDERMEGTAFLVREMGRKAQVIPHTGAIDLATTVRLTRHAQEVGAAAAAVVSPFYYGYDEEALFRYYARIAKAVSGFPVLLYNIPSCARNVLTPALVARLADACDNIVGIKDSSGNMVALKETIDRVRPGFQVINGVDEYGLESFVAGCPAVVSGLSNVVCDIYHAVYTAFRKGRLEQAAREQQRLLHAARALKHGTLLSLIKYAQTLRGYGGGYVRPPHREVTAREKKEVTTALEKLGIL